MLNGVKILDLTRFVAGPHCTLLLSDLGAEVIKVERCKKGDDLRMIGPMVNDISLWAAVLNRGKKSLSLNIKEKLGKEILLKLIKNSDVLIENFRPGIMEKLELDWKKIKKINPKIIMARIGGYPKVKNSKVRQAFDATVQAETGLMLISGEDNKKPNMIGTVLLDYTTGLNMAVGILSALYSRNKTGKGQLVETTLSDAALSISMSAVPDYFINNSEFKQNGNSDRFSSPSNTYKTKNGFMHIMAGSDDRFFNLLKAMNRIELFKKKSYMNSRNRLRNTKSLDKIVTNWTKKYTNKQLGKLLSKFSVPWGEIKNFSEFLNSDTAKKSIKKAVIKNTNISVPRCPIIYPFVKLKNKSKVPSLGQHNKSILNEIKINKKQQRDLKKREITD